MVATALSGGHATLAELLEARDWHRRNENEVREARATLLAGMYGGAPGRAWLAALAAAGFTAAARNPEGTGAMVSLPVDPAVAKALARDDGEPPAGFHLTLFHLASDAARLDQTLRDQYRQILTGFAGGTTVPTVTFTHVERFSPTDEGLEPAVVVSDSPEVYALRHNLEIELVALGLPFADDHAFRAHLTIGYYPPGEGPGAGPLAEPVVLEPPAVELNWGPDAEQFALNPPVTAAPPAPGYYVIQDGWPVSGPHSVRADALGQCEPGDDGVVYLDGTIPGGVLARAGAAPPSRALRRRRARLRRLQAAANRIDRDLARGIHKAAEGALKEAIRRASVNLRQKARTGAQKDALVSSGGRATPAVLAALGLEESRLVEHSFDSVADMLRDEAAAAERRKLAVAVKELRPDPDLGEAPDPDWTEPMLEARFGQQIDRRAELAAGLLTVGLGRLALTRLKDGPPTPGPGERLGDVPFRLVRQPVDVARGVPEGARAGIRDAAAFIDQIVREREPGATRSGQWVHGYYGEPTTPFEPHAALDGIGGPDDTDGPLDGFTDDRLANDADWPDGSHFAPDDHDGCFPAGTLVSGPVARGSTLRRYEGEMIQLAFASGQFLTATPNHPVLTPQGWVGAGFLHEGDDVVRCVDAQRIASLVPCDDDVPASIEEVATSVGVARGVVARVVPVASEHFHGDGFGSEVAVVRANGPLVFDRQAPVVEPGCEPPLGFGDEGTRSLASECSTSKSLVTVGSPPLGVMGRDSDAPTFLGGSASSHDAELVAERSQFNASLREASGDRAARDSMSGRELIHRLAGAVASDQVIEVRRFPSSDHFVYNLQTDPGWYLANGVVVHNCTCEIVEELDLADTAPEAEPVPVAASAAPSAVDRVRARHEAQKATPAAS